MISDYGIQSAPIRRDKASSNPKRPGEIYQGTVTKTYPDGRIVLYVQALGTSYGPLMPVGVTQSSKMMVGDTALCAFSNQSLTSMVVFGSSRPINQSMIMIMDTIDAPAEISEYIPEGCLAYAKDSDSYYSWTGEYWNPLVSTGPTGPQGPQGIPGTNGTNGTNGDWSTAQAVEAVTTGTLASSTAGKLLYNTAACTLTVSSATAFSVGQRVDLARLNSGTFTVQGSASATVNFTPTNTLRAQYSAATLVCTSLNTYLLMGDLG